jgi:hypothetical protein
VPLGVPENNIGSDGKHKKIKGVKAKTQNKVMKFWFAKGGLCESCH